MDTPHAPDAAPATPRPARPGVALACLSAGAGLVHAALTPSHMDAWAAEGIAFAVAAWLQLGLAAILLRRASLGALQLTVAVNVVLLAAWAVSRTTGLPLGPHSGQAEPITFVDAVTAGLEAALLVGALAVVVRPWSRPRYRPVLASIVPILAVVATSAALLSPGARDHGHGDGHDHAADDKGWSLLHNGEHAHVEFYDLDPASQTVLDEQLDVTRAAARRYATVADAEAAGYTRAGPYSPGLGVHYVRPSAEGLNADGRFDPGDLEHPLSIQYEGTEPDSRVAGFMYYSSSPTEPEGFIGRNDVWHYHSELCLRFGPDGVEAPYGADKEATQEQCDQVGGTIMEQTQWMLHVWSVPAFENPDGVFGEHNPKLACPDGTYFQLEPEEWADHLENICRSERRI